MFLWDHINTKIIPQNIQPALSTSFGRFPRTCRTVEPPVRPFKRPQISEPLLYYCNWNLPVASTTTAAPNHDVVLSKRDAANPNTRTERKLYMELLHITSPRSPEFDDLISIKHRIITSPYSSPKFPSQFRSDFRLSRWFQALGLAIVALFSSRKGSFLAEHRAALRLSGFLDVLFLYRHQVQFLIRSKESGPLKELLRGGKEGFGVGLAGDGFQHN